MCYYNIAGKGIAGLHPLWYRRCSGEKVPVPTPLSDIETAENKRAVLIHVYIPSIYMAKINCSVNRTVTLPAWLNAAALERNINFSQVLQDALKTQMHLK